MNPVLRTSAAHAFVTSLDDPRLDPDDDHHLRRVLRLRPAEVVTLSDGAGSWVTAELTAGGVAVTSGPVHEPPLPMVRLACAIPKGDRLDVMVQKLTEVGATHIILVEMARSVVRWDGVRRERQRQRLTRIVRDAASQSRRVWLPALEVGVSLAAVLERFPDATLADPDGEPWPGRPSCLVIGPEGGVTDHEAAMFTRRVELGSHVLRTETAAIVAAVRSGDSR